MTMLATGLVAGVVSAVHWMEAPSPPAVHPSPAGATAHLTGIEGAVKVKRRGTVEWVACQPAMEVAPGDLVMTGPHSAVEITYLDGFVVRVRPDTLLTVAPGSGGGAPATVDLRAGTIEGDAIRGGERSVITTPSARWYGAREGGGDPPLVEMQARPSEGTTIDQRRGGGRVIAGSGDARVLGPRTRLTVDAQGRPLATLSLLPAPVLLSPPMATGLSYRDVAHGVTRLTWTAVPGAAAYHLLVDRGAFFLQPLVDQNGLPRTSWELSGLPEGRYYWKVSAVGANGTESFSDFGRFTLAQAAGPPPSLDVDTFDRRGSVLHVAGRTDPGAILSVNGQPIEVHADGSFGEYIALPRAGTQPVTIRSISHGGEVTEQTRNLPAPER